MGWIAKVYSVLILGSKKVMIVDKVEVTCVATEVRGLRKAKENKTIWTNQAAVPLV